MSNFLICLNAVVPIFCLLTIGYLCRCCGIIKRESVTDFNKITFKVLLSSMLFYNVYDSDLNSIINIKLIAFSWLGVLAVFSVTSIFAKIFIKEESRTGVIIQGIFRSNFVIIGMPIATSLCPSSNPAIVAILISIIVPTYNVLAVICLEAFSGHKINTKKMILNIINNPLIIGSILGIIFLVFGIKLPSSIESAIKQLAQSATPISLLLLGAFFSFKGAREEIKNIAIVSLLKLAVVPGIMLTIGYYIGFRGIEFAALIGIFCSPNAVSSFTMAQQMGNDGELAADIVVATNALCSLTIFLWCFIFKSIGAL